MNRIVYKTQSANKTDIQKEWCIVDATDQVLGRLSSKVAKIIRGKNKPYFTPHIDCGDNVIIINAEKIKLTGQKLSDKRYVRHSGYPGGQKFTSPEDLLNKNPARIVEMAVKGMLPKNKLGSALFRNLYVYAGSEHPHQGQQAKEIDLSLIK